MALYFRSLTLLNYDYGTAILSKRTRPDLQKYCFSLKVQIIL